MSDEHNDPYDFIDTSMDDEPLGTLLVDGECVDAMGDPPDSEWGIDSNADPPYAFIQPVDASDDGSTHAETEQAEDTPEGNPTGDHREEEQHPTGDSPTGDTRADSPSDTPQQNREECRVQQDALVVRIVRAIVRAFR